MQLLHTLTWAWEVSNGNSGCRVAPALPTHPTVNELSATSGVLEDSTRCSRQDYSSTSCPHKASFVDSYFGYFRGTKGAYKPVMYKVSFFFFFFSHCFDIICEGLQGRTQLLRLAFRSHEGNKTSCRKWVGWAEINIVHKRGDSPS